MTTPSLAYQDAMNGIAILYDALSNAENELENLKNPWIKCTENLPEQGVKCLVFDTETQCVGMNILMEDAEWYVGYNITHWMPLPKSPNDETSANIADKLKALQSNPDKEVAHNQADKILCDLLNSLGYHDVVKEFENLEKWYA